MLYELILIGSTAFWIITSLVVLIAFMVIDEADSSGASIISTIYVAALIGLSNLSLNLSTYWWCPFPYLFIGALWFLFLMTHRVKSLRRWIDKQPYPERTIDDLKKDSYSIPSNWRHIYKTEPSWPKFTDRVLLWPLSMIKFVTGDMLRAIYDMVAEYLVSYKNRLLGIK